MTEITITMEQYNLLYGKALAFDNIVDAIEQEILLLTGVNRYRDEHNRILANKAKKLIGNDLTAWERTLIPPEERNKIPPEEAAGDA